MKISVALAVYNGTAFLREQLISLAHQTRPADEIVVCDDASSDGSAEFVRRTAQEIGLSGCTVFENDQNLGYRKNFRQAVSLCRGDLIFLCDQDDIWHPEKIRGMAECFARDDFLLSLCSAIRRVDEHGRPIPGNYRSGTNCGLMKTKTPKGQLRRVCFEEVLHGNIAPGCTMAVRKELARQFVDNSQSVLPHDWEMNLVAACEKGLAFCNREWTDYRLHSSNTLGWEPKPQTRLEIAREKAEALEQICRYRDQNEERKLLEKRLSLLSNRDAAGMAALWKNRIYRRFFSFRERLGDWRYCRSFRK